MHLLTPGPASPLGAPRKGKPPSRSATVGNHSMEDVQTAALPDGGRPSLGAGIAITRSKHVARSMPEQLAVE